MVEKSDERLLPTNKVRTIMKSCGDPSAFLSKESVLVVTKAAVSIIFFCFIYQIPEMFIYCFLLQELFISYLTQQTQKKFANKKDLNYNDLSSFVQDEEKLEFLHQIVPKKITVKEFREILERGSDSDSSDSEASSDEDDENEDSDLEEEEGKWNYIYLFLSWNFIHLEWHRIHFIQSKLFFRRRFRC